MDLSKLSRLAGESGLALVRRSEHHFQLTDPQGDALVDVWPGTNRFRKHKAAEGKKAAQGNELSAIQCAKQALPKPLPPIAACPSQARSSVMPDVKTLPDSPGYWLREGDGDLKRIAPSDDPAIAATGALYQHTNTGFEFPLASLRPGRWLKVDLPTFPPREKAKYRLCWANIAGLGRNLTLYSVYSDAFYLNGFFSKDQASDIVWLTPEFEDEIQPHK